MKNRNEPNFYSRSHKFTKGMQAGPDGKDEVKMPQNAVFNPKGLSEAEAVTSGQSKLYYNNTTIKNVLADDGSFKFKGEGFGDFSKVPADIVKKFFPKSAKSAPEGDNTAAPTKGSPTGTAGTAAAKPAATPKAAAPASAPAATKPAAPAKAAKKSTGKSEKKAKSAAKNKEKPSKQDKKTAPKVENRIKSEKKTESAKKASKTGSKAKKTVSEDKKARKDTVSKEKKFLK